MPYRINANPGSSSNKKNFSGNGKREQTFVVGEVVEKEGRGIGTILRFQCLEGIYGARVMFSVSYGRHSNGKWGNDEDWFPLWDLEKIKRKREEWEEPVSSCPGGCDGRCGLR